VLVPKIIEFSYHPGQIPDNTVGLRPKHGKRLHRQKCANTLRVQNVPGIAKLERHDQAVESGVESIWPLVIDGIEQ